MTILQNKTDNLKRNIITAVLATTTCLFAVLPLYFEIHSIMAYNIVLAAGLFVCCIVRIDFLRLRDFWKRDAQLFIPLVLFVILLGVSMISHGEIKNYVVSYLFQFIGPILLFFFFAEDRKQLNTVIDILIVFSSVICIFGIVEFFTRFNVWSLVENVKLEGELAGSVSFERNGFYRIEQSFQQCIPYASYLIAVVALAWYRFITNKTKACRIFYIVAWLLACLNIVMTYSRFALILVVLINVIFIFRLKPKFTAVMIAIVLAVAAAIFFVGWVFDIDFIIHNKYIDSFLQMFNFSAITTETATANQRLSVIRIIPERLKNHWMLGVGEVSAKEPFLITSAWPADVLEEYANNHPKIPREAVLNATFTYETNSVDNNYLFRILQYGIVGIIAFISYYAGSIGAVLSGLRAKNNVRFKDVHKRYPLVWYVLILTIIYLINWLSVAQMSEFRMYNLIIGMMFAYCRMPENSRILPDENPSGKDI